MLTGPKGSAAQRATIAQRECGNIVAMASGCLTLGEMPEARNRLRTVLGERMPLSLAKHLDEQSVAVLITLLDALGDAGSGLLQQSGRWRHWAVLGSAKQPGRIRLHENLLTYQSQGAGPISPQVVPHCSRHSLAGIVSQVLKARGQNFGVGGQPGRQHEALLAAVGLLAEGVPGVWVLWSEWDDPPRLGHAPDSLCCRTLVVGIEALATRFEQPEQHSPSEQHSQSEHSGQWAELPSEPMSLRLPLAELPGYRWENLPALHAWLGRQAAPSAQSALNQPIFESAGAVEKH